MRNWMIAALAAGWVPVQVPAQEAEIFIPNVTVTQPRPAEAAPPANALANCLANANTESCAGAALSRDGVALESFSGAPQITNETLILDLNAGSVSSSPKPPPTQPDYTAPVQTTVALPSVAITIEFDYDRADIRYDQAYKIAALTDALNDPALKTIAFAVIGHTDAAGPNAYNCRLSQLRAETVVGALRSRYVPVALYPVGFGEHVLKNVYNPRAAENRRVTFLRLPDQYDPVLTASYAVCPRY